MRFSTLPLQVRISLKANAVEKSLPAEPYLGESTYMFVAQPKVLYDSFDASFPIEEKR